MTVPPLAFEGFRTGPPFGTDLLKLLKVEESSMLDWILHQISLILMPSNTIMVDGVRIVMFFERYI